MATLVDDLTSDFSVGIDDSSAATAFPVNALAQLVNGRIEPDGTISVRPGSQRKHSTTIKDAIGYGAITYQPSTGDKQIVAFSGDTAKYSEDGGVTWNNIATGLRQDYWSLAIMRVGSTRYLFCANGGTNVKRWDGATLDNLPNVPAGVKYLAVFDNRLAVAGHNGPIVQLSKIGDPETWSTPDGLLVQILAHGSDDLTGLFQIGSHLLVFDEHATSYIDGQGESTLVVASGASGFSRSVGCIAHRSIVGVGDNEVCWLSERGIERYSPDGGIKLMSRRLRKFFMSIARSEIKEDPGPPSATYDATLNLFHLALSTTGSRNNRSVVLNVQTGALALDGPAESEGSLRFSVDSDGYLQIDEDGYLPRSELGYLSLATGGEGGDSIEADADGIYLENVDVDSLPATLFQGPSASQGYSVHSLGYDGFVREHLEATKDDVLADGTGGTDIEFRALSRPFLFRRPRNRKRARILHVSTINSVVATVRVAPVAGGVLGNFKTLTMPVSSLDQPKRKKARTWLEGDNPQVEIRSSSQIRLALLGMSAEILRDSN